MLPIESFPLWRQSWCYSGPELFNWCSSTGTDCTSVVSMLPRVRERKSSQLWQGHFKYVWKAPTSLWYWSFSMAKIALVNRDRLQDQQFLLFNIHFLIHAWVGLWGVRIELRSTICVSPQGPWTPHKLPKLISAGHTCTFMWFQIIKGWQIGLRMILEF